MESSQTQKIKWDGKLGRIQVSVKELIDEFVYNIDLEADYQRDRVWATKDQELLLDSILRDIDIPKLYLAKVEDNNQFEFECIDGKQRMLTLIKFFNPDFDEKKPLTVDIFDESYTYKRLKDKHPNYAAKIERYKLDFVIFKSLDDKKIREIFRRLQLGIRLNSGEVLKSMMGTIRDFIFTEIGKSGPFLVKTNLSESRSSREFTLAQICINSFNKKKTGAFARARYDDLKDFFVDNENIDESDENLKRIKTVLNLMDKGFNEKAMSISSRAVAVSAYLFCEELFSNKQKNKIPRFAKFYEELLAVISINMKKILNWDEPSNKYVMDQFQKYILQASVEANSIKRRHDFLIKAFAEFQDTGRIIGEKGRASARSNPKK